MDIQRAEFQDVEWLSRIISREFPYTKASRENVEKRMRKPNLFLFKLVEGKKLVGFVEIELLEDSEGSARINGIAVEKPFRKKGHGKRLLDFSIGFLRQLNVSDVFLLVKADNAEAKQLYEKSGFTSIGLSKKRIEGKAVEEMHLPLSESGEAEYLN